MRRGFRGWDDYGTLFTSGPKFRFVLGRGGGIKRENLNYLKRSFEHPTPP